jgi:hypothetical protein
MGITDSAASYVLKKVTWANIKATLLTWLQLGTTIIPQNSPRGYLINGKIVPSVASNNLTVAIKGLDGNDPSATNPVYCRIGDTERSITTALSVTKNAGTNWCNAGGANLATVEIDYFVYLGYNATDGVVIGFSRIPYATEYDDFSATTTSSKYCAISTITNAAAGDDYENIGRFAATLSAGAGYTWSVPTFTNKNLIQRPIYESRWLFIYPANTGLASYSANEAYYRISGRTVYYVGNLGGVSNATTFTGVLPIDAIRNTSPYMGGILEFAQDNSVSTTTPGKLLILSAVTTVDFYKDMNGLGWTASNNKVARFNFFYEI